MFFSNPPAIMTKDFSIASTNVFLDDNLMAKVSYKLQYKSSTYYSCLLFFGDLGF